MVWVWLRLELFHGFGSCSVTIGWVMVMVRLAYGDGCTVLWTFLGHDCHCEGFKLWMWTDEVVGMGVVKAVDA